MTAYEDMVCTCNKPLPSYKEYSKDSNCDYITYSTDMAALKYMLETNCLVHRYRKKGAMD